MEIAWSHWYLLPGAEQPLNLWCSFLSFCLPIMRYKEGGPTTLGLISAAQKNLHASMPFILVGGVSPKIYYPSAHHWEKLPWREYTRLFSYQGTWETPDNFLQIYSKFIARYSLKMPAMLPKFPNAISSIQNSQYRMMMTFSPSFKGSFNDLVAESFACVWLIEAAWWKRVFVLVWAIASKIS